MKFSKLSQLFLVSSIGLIVATLLTACSISTIDYVFVACSPTSGDGQIETFAVDSASGALRTVAAAVSSGGVSPASMAVTSDYANLYVANKTSGTVVHFTIADSGVLTAQSDSISIAAPVALAVNSAGTYLYVISGTTSATLSEYALSSGTISSPTLPTVQKTLALASYPTDTIIPTGIAVLVNNGTDILGNAVYVTAYDQSAYNPGGTITSNNRQPGCVFSFTVGTGGALTAALNSPYAAGVKPSAIAATPTDEYLYVTDYASNRVIGYTILDGSTLSPLAINLTGTGNEPSAIVIDPRGMFIYVTNALDSTVSAYEITLANGTLTVVVNPNGSLTNPTDTEPVAIIVDPALGRFVYTANYLGTSISGFLLNATSGAITATQATPYPTSSGLPTALIAVPHGNHATQSVSP